MKFTTDESYTLFSSLYKYKIDTFAISLKKIYIYVPKTTASHIRSRATDLGEFRLSNKGECFSDSM